MHRTSSSTGSESAPHRELPRCKLYFARHGETDWNAERRLQGQRDVPLNALGRKQAARCGELLQDLLAGAGATAQHFAPAVGETNEHAAHGHAVEDELVEIAHSVGESMRTACVRCRSALRT